jgi:UDP:flavonoid glycosyltransferase YjiC (YdhE family)
MASLTKSGADVRALFTCCPGFGHLYPLFPLARALRDRGATVAFLAASTLAAATKAGEFEFLQAGPGMDELLRAGRDRGLSMSGTPADQAMRKVMPLFADVRVDLALDDAVTAARAWGPSVIASDHADFIGPIMARLLGVSQVTVGFGPGHLPEWLMLASAAVAKHYAGLGFAPPANAGLYDQLYLDMWPPSLQQPAFIRPPETMRLRPEPFGRGDAGGGAAADGAGAPRGFPGRTDRPLVVVTMGTIFGKPALLSAAVAALADLDVNVLVTVGPDGDPASVAGDPARVRVERFIPLEVALRGCDLVVTHGGAGTTLAALARGIPLVMLPQSGDQFAIAELTVAACVAESIVPADFGPDALRAAVRRVMADRRYASTACRVRDEISAMPSPGQVAASVIEYARPPR